MTSPWPKWALAMLFLVDGAGFGVWAAHVPVFKQDLRLTNGDLSIVLLCLVGGAILTMPATGQVIARLGSRKVVRAVAVFYVLMIAVLAQVHSYAFLVLAAALYGAAKGAFDVSINSHGVDIEQHYKRSSMSLLQGCWSLGGLLGAGAASLLLRHHSTIRFDLTSAALVMAAVVALALPSLLDIEHKQEASTGFQWPSPSLLGLSLLAFFGLFAEGAIGDWAAVYLRSSLGITLSLAAAGYAVYAVAMASARFAGDWFTSRFNGTAILRGSGLTLAVGFGATLFSHTLPHAWIIGFIGLALTGIGMANIVPVILTVAGRDMTMGAGPAISTLSTIGYFGFLAGPPMIGWLAVGIGLSHSLLLVVFAGLAVAAGPSFAGFVRRRDNKPSSLQTT